MRCFGCVKESELVVVVTLTDRLLLQSLMMIVLVSNWKVFGWCAKCCGVNIADVDEPSIIIRRILWTGEI